jgi:phage head maturation protease
MVRRGDVKGSSFRWIPQDEDEIWQYPRGGVKPLRTLLRVRLIEVGPVSWPAYEATTAAMRSAVHRAASAELR